MKRFRRYFLIAFLAMACLVAWVMFQFSRLRKESEEHAAFFPLASAESTVPIEIPDERLVGHLSAEDRQSLARLLGRVPETSRQIVKVVVDGPAGRPEVTVEFAKIGSSGRGRVMCTKNRVGVWQITGEGRFHADSFGIIPTNGNNRASTNKF